MILVILFRFIVVLKAKQTNVFTEFILTVEPHEGISSPSGNLYLLDPSLTRFSSKCRNTLIQTNTLGKTRVSVTWIAPPEASGCVTFKASVLEASDNWFSDGDGLTKDFCEEDTANPDNQTPYLEKCCACDEAKYEMAFQGLWSRNTHPKDFPSDPFTTKFSDIVGASHKLGRSFWEYDTMASEAMQRFAEDGDPSLLETELKKRVKNGDIRTIIKARELPHPNRTGTSYTNFRVDRNSHVISVVSRITPSPDWIVGVANFELCTPDCGWVKTGVLNLYPWDIGTDDGESYYAPKTPSMPQRLIRRIYSDDDSPSPFHDDEPIKPLAKLTLIRQKVYEKTCDVEEETTEEPETTAEPEEGQNEHDTYYDVNPPRQGPLSGDLVQEPVGSVVNCKVSRWTDWSQCNATAPCSQGYKVKNRQIIQHAENGGEPCPRRIFKKRKCYLPCRQQNSRRY